MTEIRSNSGCYPVIGLMSGTSLDGLDIAFCRFELSDNRWSYKIQCAETIPYSQQWKARLSGLMAGSAIDLVKTDVDLGHLFGALTRKFIGTHQIRPDFIASHGHTIYHQPQSGITCQIGKGSAIAAETRLPVISDFRSLDVALGGQGAPLVPVGDKLLFGEFGFCLNLGGFANISYDQSGKRIAFDTGPANIVLNYLASLAGSEYDRDGLTARGGNIIGNLLDRLNDLPYFRLDPPKSLGKEWVDREIMPLVSNSSVAPPDLLATFCEHIAIQIGRAVKNGSEGAGKLPEAKILITGGGALNTFLVERIAHHVDAEVTIPDLNTINYKEALIFALLGVLKIRHEINCLSSVTGASRDSSGGSVT